MTAPMNMAAEALNILDKVKPGTPATFTERDLKILHCAVTGEAKPPVDWTGRAKHIYDVPVLAIGNTGILTMNARLMVELRSANFLHFAVVDGAPVIRPDPTGAKITKSPRSRTGQAVVQEIKDTARRHELTGTKWRMQRDGDRWRGTAQIRNP